VFDAGGVFFRPIITDPEMIAAGIQLHELALYITFYGLASIIALPLVGRWMPKIDNRLLLSVSMAMVCVALAAMSLYHHPWQWWISGAFFGLFGSFIFVMAAPVLINNWFQKRRGLALGIGMSCSGIGGAILAPAFAAIIDAVGWRTGYLYAALIIAVMTLPFCIFVFRYKPADMGLKPYGWTDEDERISQSIAKEKQALPGVPARKAIFTVPFICMFLFAGFVPFCGALNAQLPNHMGVIGFEPVTAATIISAVMVGNVTEKLIVGYLNDKIGVQFTMNLQLILVTLGFCGLIYTAYSGNHYLPLIYISAFLFGAQNSLISVSIPLMIRQLFGNKDYTKILAYARMGNGLIGAIWPSLIAMTFDITHMYVIAFTIGIGLMVASFLLSRLAYGQRKKLQWQDLPDDPEEAKRLRESKLASTL